MSSYVLRDPVGMRAGRGAEILWEGLHTLRACGDYCCGLFGDQHKNLPNGREEWFGRHDQRGLEGILARLFLHIELFPFVSSFHRRAFFCGNNACSASSLSNRLLLPGTSTARRSWQPRVSGFLNSDECEVCSGQWTKSTAYWQRTGRCYKRS